MTSSSSSLQLKAEALELIYQGRAIWTIEQLHWSAGQSIWLQGHNGSGKSSLLKTLAGLQKPTRGRVYLTSRSNPLLAGCCYLHQQPYMFNSSVSSNLRLALQSRKAPAAKSSQLLADALAWSGLAAKANQPAQTLSGGERQRLALARAWIVQPSFWLLDEPTANLDTKGVEELASLIQDLQQRGCGLMITSHQKNPVTQICKESWLLHQGQLTRHS